MKMQDQRIDSLDTSVFEPIASQTSQGDKRSLLAVQRATASKHKTFSYLEIGSHLGGSIQPYLLDPRCENIISIDPRPAQQPDDRCPGYIAHYENNSSTRMLTLLQATGYGDIRKITCIEQGTSGLDPAVIHSSPEVAFIDGEHTKAAVLSDFHFCERVISKSGTIVFHDFFIVYPAVLEIQSYLNGTKRSFVPLKLEDNIFAIFLSAETVRSDPYLAAIYSKNRHYLRWFLAKQQLLRFTPPVIIAGLRSVRNSLRFAGRGIKAALKV
jgi:hypothetical protein